MDLSRLNFMVGLHSVLGGRKAWNMPIVDTKFTRTMVLNGTIPRLAYLKVLLLW
jgi:hypothetical protein